MEIVYKKENAFSLKENELAIGRLRRNALLPIGQKMYGGINGESITFRNNQHKQK